MAPSGTASQLQNAQQPSGIRSLLQLPAPIRYLFDHTPLFTYPSNELPLRGEAQYQRRFGHDEGVNNVLYVFTTEEDAKQGRPSLNPNCLKWQTLLKFHGIRHITCPSSNHASPTGVLPFLLPLHSHNLADPPPPVSTKTLPSHLGLPTPSPKSSLYNSLLSHTIRLAYLHALYLDTETFKSITIPLYVAPCTRNGLVRAVSAHSLRSAAEEELLKGCGIPEGELEQVDIEGLYVAMEDAWEALSQVLGSEKCFDEVLGTREDANGKMKGPGELDASVFAYSHVIISLLEDQKGRGAEDGSAKTLQESKVFGKGVKRLYEGIRKHKNLVQHHDLILVQFSNDENIGKQASAQN